MYVCIGYTYCICNHREEHEGRNLEDPRQAMFNSLESLAEACSSIDVSIVSS